MKKGIVCLIVCLYLISFSVEAKPAQQQPRPCYEAVPLGVIEPSTKVLIYKQYAYPLYSMEDKDYLLIHLGQDKMQAAENRAEIKRISELPEIKEKAAAIEKEIVYMAEQPVYIGNIRSYAVKTETGLFVPVEAAAALGPLVVLEKAYLLEEKPYESPQYFKMDETSIENTMDYPINVRLTHLFWNGETIQVKEEEKYFKAHESMPKSFVSEQLKAKEALYITSIAEPLEDLVHTSDTESFYGQKDAQFWKRYTTSKRKEELNVLFPRYRLMGKLNDAAGPFKAHEEVEIWRAEKNTYYVVRDQKGKTYHLPCGSVKLETKWVTLPSHKITKEDLEDFVNLNEVESETDYCIWTDIYRQRTHVFRKINDKWAHEKTFVCSSGKEKSITPQGFFKVEYLIPYFGTGKNFRCKNAVVFFKDYMFHSILFDKTGTYIKSGQYELGQRVSHGCIRLSETDSRWLYTHIPVKSTVWIR